jgi:hypothetical protein
VANYNRKHGLVVQLWAFSIQLTSILMNILSLNFRLKPAKLDCFITTQQLQSNERENENTQKYPGIHSSFSFATEDQ